MNVQDTTRAIINRLGLTGQHWAFAAVEAELLNAKPLSGVSLQMVREIVNKIATTRDDKHREKLLLDLRDSL